VRATGVNAQRLQVTDEAGNPVAAAMVSRTMAGSDIVDRSDNGYPKRA
jgi:hypothetical protein